MHGLMREGRRKPVLYSTSFNRDGSERHNSRHRRLAAAIAVSDTQLKQLQADKARLPERVNVAGLSDYRSFNAIDNECYVLR
jgi:hypothetical protein